MVSAARANLAGRIGDCEGLAYQAQAIGQDSVAENAFTYFSAQFFSVRRWQCRLGEFEAVVAGLTDSMPHLPLWRCALAYLYAELDRPEEAGTELARLAHDSYSALPRDASWLMAISLLADVAGYLADAENAALLYRLMGPYQDRVIVAGFAGVSHGSAARCLGVLASAMGRFESAQGHFETALRLNGRLGAAAWLAHTQVDYADMLGARGAPGDSARARQLVETAEAEFRDLGLDAFAARAGQRLDRLETPTAGVLSLVGGSAGNHAAEPGRGSPLFCRGGDYWEINFSGPSFRLRDSRGLRHLAQLLAEPGQEVHALVLLASVQGNASPCELAMASGDSGPILDSAAVSSYRRRLVDLSEDLDEAERFSDLERSAAIQRERDFILDELASGLGLGGRTRRASSAAERARISATKAIKGATRRIANEDAALGRHLTASVRTGYFCRYAPDPADTPDWTM